MSTEQHAPEKGYTLRVEQPTQLKIVEPSGKVLLTIHHDGRWEFRDDRAPTEAARVFVREVQRMVMPGEVLAAQLRGLAADPHARAVLAKAYLGAGLANAAEALHALADGLTAGTVLRPELIFDRPEEA